MLKIVLDTNVIVSAHLNPDGLERAVLNFALASKGLVVSREILVEYSEVLRRKRFSIDPSLVDQSMGLIEASATKIASQGKLSVSKHEPDNRFLECAQAAEADFLVTGNRRHFPTQWRRTRIVSARELLEIIGGP